MADTVVPLAQQGVQALDRYAGMNNNPVKYTDPSGHMISDGCESEGCSSRDADAIEHHTSKGSIISHKDGSVEFILGGQIHLIFMEPGSPIAINRTQEEQNLALFLSLLGMGMDGFEIAGAFSGLGAFAFVTGVIDVGITSGASNLSGQGGLTPSDPTLAPFLPPMYLADQDMLVTATDAIVATGAQVGGAVVGGAVTFITGNPVPLAAGIAAGEAVDIVTSGISIVNDVSSLLGSPNVVSMGYSKVDSGIYILIWQPVDMSP